MRKYVLFCLVFFLCFTIASSEETEILDVDECVDIALKKSFGIRTYENTLEGAEADYLKSLAQFKPKISFFIKSPDYSESVDEFFLETKGTYAFVENKYLNHSARMDAKMTLPGDGNLRLSYYGLNRRQDVVSSFSSDNITEDFSNAIRLSWDQPILAFDEREDAIERAKLQKMKADKEYENKVSDLIFRAKRAYYSLVRAKGEVQISKDRYRQSQKSYKRAKQKYQSGLIPEVEALELEVGMKQNKAALRSRKAQMENQKEDLQKILDMDFDEDIRVNLEMDYNPVTLDKKEVVKYALEHHNDIRIQQIQKKLSRKSLERAKHTKDFKLNISTFIEYFDQGKEWDKSTDNFTRNRGATLSVSIPVYDSGREKYSVLSSLSELKNTELRLEEKRKEIEKLVRESIRDIEEAASRVKTLEESKKVARKSYEISEKRFNAGTITSQRLLDSQLALSDTRISYLSAMIDYKLSRARLKRILKIRSLKKFIREDYGSEIARK